MDTPVVHPHLRIVAEKVQEVQNWLKHRANDVENPAGPEELKIAWSYIYGMLAIGDAIAHELDDKNLLQ